MYALRCINHKHYVHGHEPVTGEPERSEEDFCAEVSAQIPYFNHANHVRHTLAKMGLEWLAPEHEECLWEILEEYASKRADEKAAAEEGKLL